MARSPEARWTSLKPIGLTFVVGFIGAGLGTLMHLPVPALLGSGILVSIFAFTRLPLAMPDGMRNIGFTVLGCSMGSGVTPEMLGLVGRWPASLLLLTLTVVIMMASGVWLLSRFFGMDRHTALLACTPGGASTVLAIATEDGADVRAVVVLQILRLLLVMAFLPLIIQTLGLQGAQGNTASSTIMSWHSVLLLVLAAYGVARLLAFFKVPAAFVLSGLLLSGFTHMEGWLEGRLPVPLVTLAFVIVGCMAGVRFVGVRLAEMKRYSVAALASVGLSTLISALLAGLAAWLLSLPFGQVWIAYSPGGIEAMAALAMALHFDPAYIAAHHLFRIVGLTLLLPLFSGWMKVRTRRPDRQT
ncbi:MAG TPA: AbrB family transcriptional regulator [Thiolinea sp.]|nr:AbrB family transcriptional regulator [Thiolinea sp.]